MPPENCRWVTAKQNSLNKRTNRYITWRGKTQTLAEWPEEVKIPAPVILQRLAKGWDLDRVMLQDTEQYTADRKNYLSKYPRTPNKRTHFITWNGCTQPLSVWAKELGLDWHTLLSRLEKLHWTVERALTPRKGGKVSH